MKKGKLLSRFLSIADCVLIALCCYTLYSNENNILFFVLLVIGIIVIEFIKGKLMGDNIVVPIAKSTIRLKGITVITAVVFFVDFVWECYMCYCYVCSQEYINWSQICVQAVLSLFALLCCLYFIILFAVMNGARYDLTKLDLFHPVVVAWSFFKIIFLLTQITDINQGKETLCELAFESFVIAFWLCLSTSIDSAGACAVSSVMRFSGECAISFAVAYAVPMCLTDFTIALLPIFALALFIFILFGSSVTVQNEAESLSATVKGE